MRSRDFSGMSCSIAAVMGALGDRWGVLIMRDILLGLTRYDDLHRSTNVTNATLSDRLKSLEQNGLIERHAYHDRPLRYEYKPTSRGRDVGLMMQAMVQVGDGWNLAGLDAPPLRFVDQGSGRRVRLAVVDADTGEEVPPSRLAIEAGGGADELTHWRLAQGAATRQHR